MNGYVLFFLVATSFPVASFAQTDLAFPDSDAVWILGTVHSDGPGDTDYSTAQYTYGNDTTINGLPYHSLLSIAGSSSDYACAIRKDSLERVYIVPEDSLQEFLLYDFSADAGDTLAVWSYSLSSPGINTITVSGIDSIQQDATYFKVFVVGDLQFSQSTWWVKGIGSTDGLIEPFYQPSVSERTFLQCFTVNNELIYPLPEAICFGVNVEEPVYNLQGTFFYPNPTSGELHFQSPFPASCFYLKICNSAGTCVYADEQCNADVVINIRSFNNGLYFAELRGKQEVYRVKFTKAD